MGRRGRRSKQPHSHRKEIQNQPTPTQPLASPPPLPPTLSIVLPPPPPPPPPAPRRVLTPLVKAVGSFFSNRRLAREKREAQARVDEMRKQVLEEDEFMAKIRARDELIRLRREQHQVTLDEERR